MLIFANSLFKQVEGFSDNQLFLLFRLDHNLMEVQNPEWFLADPDGDVGA